MLQNSSIQEKTIGVIGYGKFGQVVCNNLFPQYKILVYSQHAEEKQFPQHISTAKSIQELGEKSDIIIPAVPTREFESVIKTIKPFLKPQAIVMDVCSVKEYPVEIMKQYLPENISIIATHPMFGPNSLSKRNNNLETLSFVIYNVHAENNIYNEVKKYFKELGLDVIEISPSEHDKLSAYSQFFALLIGELGKELHIKHTNIDTPGASAIINALEYMGTDKEIIEDMIRYNKYCKEVLNRIINTLKVLKN